MGALSERLACLMVALVLLGCGDRERTRAPVCEARAPAPHPLPGVRPEHRTLAYWLERWEARHGSLDAPVMSVEEIAEHDRALAEQGRGGLDDAALAMVPSDDRIASLVRSRLTPMYEAASLGRLVDQRGERLGAAELRALVVPDALPPARPEVRIALSHLPLRCTPRTDGLYSRPVDRRFDRNLCSTIRPQEPVQLLLRWPNGMTLARTRYTSGWIDADAALGPRVPEEVLRLPRILVREAPALGVPPNTILFGASGSPQLWIASARGLSEAPMPAGAFSTVRPLTRRAFLEEAFAHLDTPYGWAGADGGRDCSQLVMEIFAAFDLHLPRNSRAQALAATSGIGLDASQGAREREDLIESASRDGIVLLQLPGHVMIYLGTSREGTPMVLHAIAEYLEPCEGGHTTLRTVDRVTISDLSLGEGTSRRSLLERITRIAVLGRSD